MSIKTLLIVVVLAAFSGTSHAGEPLAVGDERQLFVDGLVIDELDGDAERKMHRPEPQEVVLVTGEPWEGNTCAYYTVFEDQGKLRMYYRGSHYDTKTKKATHPEFTCYAESSDGIHWVKPRLGLFEFNGTRENNIVWAGVGTHNFTPFRDTNPDCPPEARYKALARGRSLKQGDITFRHGLYAFQSPDGLNWSLMHDQPVITDGAFDSQNLAFWDQQRGLYVDYHRKGRNGVRDIMTCTSSDFLTWTKPEFLEYPGADKEHLYTNAIRRYERAPQLLLGFPTRFSAKTQQVEPILMSSRDGKIFERWKRELIPITAPKDRDGNRSNYMANGLVELPGHPDEISVYASEAYYTGPNSRLRRFTFRKDGFVSVHSASSGSLLTQPMQLKHDNLELNYRTLKDGVVRVAVLTADGQPIEGFTAEDCRLTAGNHVAARVTWGKGRDLSDLEAGNVRLRIDLSMADLYSFRFYDHVPNSR